MHIKIINPNTTNTFTARSLALGRAVAASGTEISAGQPAAGTPSVESHVEEAVAAIGVIEEVRAGEQAGVDGYVIACFGDTGVHAAREIARGPVVGMTEAAFYAASMVAATFAIVTLPSRTRIHAERVLRETGLERRCVAIRAIDLGVLDLETQTAAVEAAFLAEARRAIVDDHAEAIVLGCAGLSELVRPMTASLGVPVIDGVAAAVKMAEALVALGLGTSKSASYGYPPQQGSAPFQPGAPGGRPW
jgi:allantoin racemase